jgi:hypothetical protein
MAKKIAKGREIPKLEITQYVVDNRPKQVPFVISYGMGVDSTAVIVECVNRGIVPDLIQFADTGDELDETYAYLKVINRYLQRYGYPTVTVVSKRSKHKSLYHNCLANQTLPSLAYGKKACSQKWKVDPMNYFCNHWAPAKECWKSGLRVIKAIGYDASLQDVNRFCNIFKEEEKRRADGKIDTKYVYWYPLIEWGITRDQCINIIQSAGLPVPIKSACFMCPARRGEELVQLVTQYPTLAEQAVKLEHNAREGVHGLRSVKGLGRTYSWEDKFREQGIDFGITDDQRIALKELLIQEALAHPTMRTKVVI